MACILYSSDTPPKTKSPTNMPKWMFPLLCILLSGHSLAETSTDKEEIEWQSLDSWTEGQFPYKGQIVSIPHTIQEQKAIFLGTLKASGACFYPQFEEKNDFVKQVNQLISQNAKTTFSGWLTKISNEEMVQEPFDQEALDLAFNIREFQYKLTPVYASTNFISLFGETNRFSGMPHGGSRYSSLNFFWNGSKAVLVTLEQMMEGSKEFADFLPSYCLRSLKENRIGYFDYADDFSETIEIQLEDCKVVTLSKTGLIITFPPYLVGGWADGPYSVTVPFSELSKHTKNKDIIALIINDLQINNH